MDIENTFDSHDHPCHNKRIWFGKNFLSWVEVLLNNQESCWTKYLRMDQMKFVEESL